MLRRTGSLPCSSATARVVGGRRVSRQARAGIKHRDEGVVIWLARLSRLDAIGFSKVIRFLWHCYPKGIAAAVHANGVEIPRPLNDDSRATGHLDNGRNVHMRTGYAGAQVLVHIDRLACRCQQGMLNRPGGRWVGLDEIGNGNIGCHRRVRILHRQIFLETIAYTARVKVPGHTGGRPCR